MPRRDYPPNNFNVSPIAIADDVSDTFDSMRRAALLLENSPIAPSCADVDK